MLYGIKYRRLTIVFWDISGFSILCNDLVKNQSAIAAFLKEYFSSTIEVISKYEGVLDKFMGDGIMAYFGYPVENKDHSALAIHAALDLRVTFKK
jgi:class 3 adenylate cyclase